ncbi:MAG: macro domain-containing protein [Clostridia bacterium]|nr:macro domain-containing protein [Clostridia bacterium]
MPFYIRTGDITRIPADAIVNAANPSLLGGGGVDGAIHRAAGPGLSEECAALGGCEPGEAKITGAYRLPAKHVIHTVGPVWQGGGAGERDLLASCYRASLDLAEEAGCATVAFPLISAGAYGVPRDEAIEVAVGAITAWLGEHDPDMRVDLVLYENRLRDRYRELGQTLGTLFRRPSAHASISFAGAAPNLAFPKAESAGKRKNSLFRRREKKNESAARESAGELCEEAFPADADMPLPPAAAPQPKPTMFEDTLSFEQAKPQSQSQSLADAVAMIDESFSEMLLRKIDERGMKDSECYRRANVDRKLFSKIRSDLHYRPSKPTAIAFAIALELSMEETEELLLKAGYALSPSTEFDIIIRYFIERRNYNLFAINEALFAFDQNQLGA